MTISFKCSNCGNPFEVGDELAGKLCLCKKCNTRMQIPAPAPQPSSTPDNPFQEEGSGLADEKPGQKPILVPEQQSSPYAPPTAGALAPAAVSHEFRAVTGLVGVLTVMFVLKALMDGIFACLDMAAVTMDVTAMGSIDLGDGQEIYAFDLLYTLGGLAMLGIFLLTSILLLVWVNRANKNARALGAQGMEFTPGWCVGWWFVPIMNLFKPFQAVREIFQASSPTATATNWKQSPVSSLLGLWWGLSTRTRHQPQAICRRALERGGRSARLKRRSLAVLDSPRITG